MDLRHMPPALAIGSPLRGPNNYSWTRFFSHLLCLAKYISTNYDGMVHSTTAYPVGLDQGHGIPPHGQAAIPTAADPRRYRRCRYSSSDTGTPATRSGYLGGCGRGPVGRHATVHLRLAGPIPSHADF